MHRPQIHLHGSGRRPGVDNAPRDKSLALRIANEIYRGIDILALELRNFGIEPSNGINAAGEQRACCNQGHPHVDVPSVLSSIPQPSPLR